jgi:hypothetical protein
MARRRYAWSFADVPARELVSFEELPPSRACEGLGDLLASWAETAAAGGQPFPARFDIAKTPPALLGWVHLVDCSPPDPLDFRFLVAAAFLDAALQRPVDLTGSVLRSLGDSSAEGSLARACDRAKRDGTPVFGLVRRPWRRTSQARLILPVGAAGADRLVVAFSPPWPGIRPPGRRPQKRPPGTR